MFPGIHPQDAFKLLVADGLIAKIPVETMWKTTTTFSATTAGNNNDDEQQQNNNNSVFDNNPTTREVIEEKETVLESATQTMGVVLVTKEIMAKQEMMSEQAKLFKTVPSSTSSAIPIVPSSTMSSKFDRKLQHQHSKMSSIQEFLQEEYVALADPLMASSRYTPEMFH